MKKKKASQTRRRKSIEGYEHFKESARSQEDGTSAYGISLPIYARIGILHISLRAKESGGGILTSGMSPVSVKLLYNHQKSKTC